MINESKRKNQHDDFSACILYMYVCAYLWELQGARVQRAT